MKNTFFILFILFIYACKKETPKPNPDGGNNGGSTTFSSSKIKSTRTLVYKFSELVQILNAEMSYANTGQLLLVKYIDSLKMGEYWGVNPYLKDSMSYTAFNKIKYFGTNRGDLGLFIDYLYDTNNKLKEERSRNVWSDMDTTRYYYISNSIRSEKNLSSGDTEISYFSTDLDSTLQYSSNELVLRTLYERNSKADPTEVYQNQFYAVPQNVKELVKKTLINYNSGSVFTKELLYSRSYFSNGKTKELTVTDNAASSYTITQYTYF